MGENTYMNKKEKAYFGDIHNHCNISYGKGSFSDAIRNAKQKLDFCSITGHAHWCDMPNPNERIGYIIDFHKVGFAKLKEEWQQILQTIKENNIPNEFLLFPGFEIHSNADGDLTIVYCEDDGDIIYTATVKELQDIIKQLNAKNKKVFTMPHHIGYKIGARGINWENFDENVSPIVEIYSMHGCSENTQSPFPYRHSMGPADWESTMQYGLEKGHIFGFAASTDHHSAYPASYGQGFTGVWAEELTRKAIYEAIKNRRTYALSGDKVLLDFTLDNSPMGSIRKAGLYKGLKAHIKGGGAIDCVDILKNNKIVKRISSCDIEEKSYENNQKFKSLVHLEVGWGHRGKRQDWDVEFGILDGEIIDVEPRFRGADILSPVQKDVSANGASAFYSQCERVANDKVKFSTITYGNPTNTTAGTQGVCIEVEATKKSKIWTRINGIYKETPISELLCGGRVGYLIDEIDSPSWLIHKMPLQEQFIWDIDLPEFEGELKKGDTLYLRVRQENEQWAWASPVFAR